jgi:hypothetical protein
MIGSAAQRSYSSLWPSIAAALIFRMAPSSFFKRKPQPGSPEELAEKAEQAETLRVAVLTTDVMIRATASALPDHASLQAVSFVSFLAEFQLISLARIPMWQRAFSNMHRQ